MGDGRSRLSYLIASFQSIPDAENTDATPALTGPLDAASQKIAPLHHVEESPPQRKIEPLEESFMTATALPAFTARLILSTA